VNKFGFPRKLTIVDRQWSVGKTTVEISSSWLSMVEIHLQYWGRFRGSMNDISLDFYIRISD